MKNAIISSLAACALLFGASAFAQTSASGEALAKCPPPAKPDIPNGRTASEEEMLAAQRSIKEYQTALGGYRSCLAGLEQSWGESATEEQKAVVVLLHNRAVDEEAGVADLFNQSVRAFKGKSR